MGLRKQPSDHSILSSGSSIGAWLTYDIVRTPALTRPTMDSRNIGTDNPIVPDFPIVVDVLVAGPSCLLPVFAWFDFRGVLELLFGNVDLEAIGLFVVGQHRPGNRIVILADAEESAETQDRVFEAMSDD